MVSLVKKKILFRADAAPHIGIGDLMSLINISKYFDETYEKYFIIKSFPAGVNLVKKYLVDNYLIIDFDISIDDEVKYINDFIENENIDIIFFEITERKLSQYHNIKKDIKKIAVNFDGQVFDGIDLIINWDVEAYKYFDQLKYPNSKFLLGPEYVILPKEFYTHRVKQRKNNPKSKIMIAMGGADEFDFTSQVVSTIVKSGLDVELNIVVGSGYVHLENLQEILKNSIVGYDIKQNITNMLDEYLSCDIGIGAGGLTSSEMIAAKISPIFIATYEHQIARCKYFDKMGWAKYLGFREFNSKELINAIANPIKPLKEDIFDTKVIVDEIKKLECARLR
jgi:spore coat polysaccharide biosynthesis predicted glycosyltransferase SpsG